ncbi:MAG: J domain-containing protein [Chlorobi bacterium]|nr:J domain-containing protein [Chlorobiota bacterium]
MGNISKLRDIADNLSKEGNFDGAYIIYDEINNQIWAALGSAQQGLNEFSKGFLTHNMMQSIEFKNSYSPKVMNSIFTKRFHLDIDQTVNEFIFSLYGHLSCLVRVKELWKAVPSSEALAEFLTLYTLIIHSTKSRWVNHLLQINTPVVNENHLTRLRSNFSLDLLENKLMILAKPMLQTDWSHLNNLLGEYLGLIGKRSSALFSFISGNTKTGGKRKYKSYKRYRKYERYEKYEEYESYDEYEETKHKTFNAKKATEKEKAAFYGAILELTGLVTKSQIKKKYLELITKHHPDKVSGLGKEIVELAERKTKELNEAFGWFKKKYNI